MSDLRLILGTVIPTVVLLGIFCFIAIRKRKTVYQLDPDYRRQNFEKSFSRRVNISRTSSKKGLIPGINSKKITSRPFILDSESVSSHFSTDRQSSINTVA